MLQIIDNTLTGLDHALPSKEDLHLFCELLQTIGVDEIELSLAAYEKMEHLPGKGKFILNVNRADEIRSYPGFHRYICRHEEMLDRLIPEKQINDPRELIKLMTLQGYKEIRITGLDDLLCHPYDKILMELTKSLPGCDIIFGPENNYRCASAIAVLWLQEYGKNITTSFAGLKNNAATEEVIMSMRLAVRHKPNSNLTVLPGLCDLYEKMTGNIISNKKPIIGKHIFQVEAGIHADGIMKNPATYEAYKPSCVGQKSELVIGKHSGTKAVRLKLEELCLPVPEEDGISRILHIVKQKCTNERKSLSNTEFVRLIREVAVNERN